MKKKKQQRGYKPEKTFVVTANKTESMQSNTYALINHSFIEWGRERGIFHASKDDTGTKAKLAGLAHVIHNA